MSDATVATPAFHWLGSVLRLLLLLAAGLLVWLIASQWDRWTGSLRYITTDDAYVTGDLTPLASKVSGYVSRVTVSDYQFVHRDDLLFVIEPSDYQAALEQAEANEAAAAAALANLANQKAVQRALIQQAQATLMATAADARRYDLEAERQHALLRTRIVGTEQAVEQADDNEERAAAQRDLAGAQLQQRRAELASLDVQQSQFEAQVKAAQAAVLLARDNVSYTRIAAPADGRVGQRQVQLGQYIAAGTQVAALMPLPGIWVIANFKETQMTRIRVGQPAQVTVDAFPGLALHGHVLEWAPGTGSVFALLAPDNATGNFTKVVQRIPVKIILDPDPNLGSLVRPGMSVEAAVDTGETLAPPVPGGPGRAGAAAR